MPSFHELQSEVTVAGVGTYAAATDCTFRISFPAIRPCEREHTSVHNPTVLVLCASIAYAEKTLCHSSALVDLHSHRTSGLAVSMICSSSVWESLSWLLTSFCTRSHHRVVKNVTVSEREKRKYAQ